jgi:hypothetical protein
MSELTEEVRTGIPMGVDPDDDGGAIDDGGEGALAAGAGAFDSRSSFACIVCCWTCIASSCFRICVNTASDMVV